MSEKIMNTLDYLTDRVQDCTRKEIVNMIYGIMEGEATKEEIDKVLKECWF